MNMKIKCGGVASVIVNTVLENIKKAFLFFFMHAFISSNTLSGGTF